MREQPPEGLAGPSELFPVMESDLVARPPWGGHTPRALEAMYWPRRGLTGVIGGTLFWRVVARSTTAAFAGKLAQAIEGAATEHRRRNWSSLITSDGTG